MGDDPRRTTIASPLTQGFFFSRKLGLQFGLVQREGGPCGVLAAVQAHVLANLQVRWARIQG